MFDPPRPGPGVHEGRDPDIDRSARDAECVQIADHQRIRMHIPQPLFRGGGKRLSPLLRLDPIRIAGMRHRPVFRVPGPDDDPSGQCAVIRHALPHCITVESPVENEFLLPEPAPERPGIADLPGRHQFAEAERTVTVRPPADPYAFQPGIDLRHGTGKFGMKIIPDISGCRFFRLSGAGRAAGDMQTQPRRRHRDGPQQDIRFHNHSIQIRERPVPVRRNRRSAPFPFREHSDRRRLSTADGSRDAGASRPRSAASAPRRRKRRLRAAPP